MTGRSLVALFSFVSESNWTAYSFFSGSGEVKSNSGSSAEISSRIITVKKKRKIAEQPKNDFFMQPDLIGNSAYLGFVQRAHRKQGFGQLRLVQPVQKIALVFVGIASGQQGNLAVGKIPTSGIMAGCHVVCTQLKCSLQKQIKLDLAVAQDVRVGCATRPVLSQKMFKE